MLRRLGLHLGNLPREAIGKSLVAATAIFCCIMGAAYWAAHKRRSVVGKDDSPLVDFFVDQEIATSTIALAAVMTAALTLAFFVLVHRAATQTRELATFADQNAQLKQELEIARSETSRTTEHILGRVGQELHDGPIQLLSILSLKLFEPRKAKPRHDAAPGVQDLLTRAIGDLRKIAVGLVLPQLDDLSTAETLRLAVAQHETITGTRVTQDIGDLPFCSTSQRKCLYRVVREALNNSYRHANGNGQLVRALSSQGSITVVVSDNGPDPSELRDTPIKVNREPSLGLDGLRRSVQEMDGSFEVQSQGDGMLVTATISVIAQ